MGRIRGLIVGVGLLSVFLGVVFVVMYDKNVPAHSLSHGLPQQDESQRPLSDKAQLEGQDQNQPSALTPSLTPIGDPSDPVVQTLQGFPIPVMRQRAYPGSPLTEVSALPATATYSQSVVSYQSDGLTIRALLTEPLGEPPAEGWPAIVFVHGYIPPEQYQTTARYEAYVDTFARNGYVVLKIDLRGHGLSEGDPTGAYFSPGYTVDALNAVSSLQQDVRVNPEAIGMWGHSMGGYITLRSMVISDQIKAGVIWAGVIGPYPQIYDYWQSRTSTWRPSQREQQADRIRSEDLISRFGEPSEEDPFWQSISPYYYLVDLSGPVQLHQGTADAQVPVIYHQTVADRINELGVQPVEEYEYQGADHNLSGAAFGPAAERSVAFFDRYLK